MASEVSVTSLPSPVIACRSAGTWGAGRYAASRRRGNGREAAAAAPRLARRKVRRFMSGLQFLGVSAWRLQIRGGLHLRQRDGGSGWRGRAGRGCALSLAATDRSRARGSAPDRRGRTRRSDRTRRCPTTLRAVPAAPEPETVEGVGWGDRDRGLDQPRHQRDWSSHSNRPRRHRKPPSAGGGGNYRTRSPSTTTPGRRWLIRTPQMPSVREAIPDLASVWTTVPFTTNSV